MEEINIKLEIDENDQIYILRIETKGDLKVNYNIPNFIIGEHEGRNSVLRGGLKSTTKKIGKMKCSCGSKEEITIGSSTFCNGCDALKYLEKDGKIIYNLEICV